MASFYRNHIVDFAKITRFLYDLTKKNVPFVWGDNVQASFNEVKDKMAQSILLFHPDLDSSFTIECDTSGIAVGAVLKQDGRIISVVSKALKNHELNWAIRDKELYSIVFACQKFHFYIEGKSDTTVFSDHKSLIYLKTTELSGRLARWAMLLMPYNLNIQYIKGGDNSMADHLTRMNDLIMEDNMLEGNILAMTRSQHKQPFMKQSNINKIHIEAGHVSGLKLYDYIVSRGHQVKRDDCVAVFTRCDICMSSKKNINQHRRNPRVDYGDYPFDTIGMDVIGKLPVSEHNGVEYNYILTITDYFSKWVELIPLSIVNAPETLDAFRLNWITRYGRPRKIITDLGSNFDNQLFKTFCKDNNVELHYATTGYKQGNAVAERVNYTVMEYIRANLKEDNQWVTAI